jgi:hypothetical protein
VHEIAKPASVAFAVFILATTCFTEVSDGGQFCVQWSARIPAIVQIIHSSLRLCFPFVSGVNVPNQVVADIIANMQLQQMPKLGKLAIKIFVHCVKTLLQLPFVEFADRVMGRVMIYIGEKNGL